MPTFYATPYVDQVSGSREDDIFVFWPGTVQAGDYFDAVPGLLWDIGTDYMFIHLGWGSVFDFRGATLRGFEGLQLDGEPGGARSSVILYDYQVADPLFHLIGEGFYSLCDVEVYLTTGEFSASHWKFDFWFTDRLSIFGTDIADTIVGSQQADTLDGRLGDDVLDGGAENDVIFGGAGADVINGGDGNDTIAWSWGDGADAIDGGADVDTLNISGDAAANLIYASWNGVALANVANVSLTSVENVNADLSSGTDWLIYTAESAAATVNLAANSSSGFASIAGIEHVVGGNGDDALTGDGLENRLGGGAGDDVLNGAGGVDMLVGGDGTDVLIGGLGVDTIQGGAGNDTITYAMGDGNGTIDGGADTDTLNLSDGASDSLLNATYNGAVLTALAGNGLTGVENINANLGGGVDWLIYSAASASVAVNLGTGAASGFASIAGVERVVGGSHNDWIIGDGLDNRLDGAFGNDTLIGGDGADTLIGGLGNDAFVYAAGAGADTINDFDAWDVGGQDLIDITQFGITAGDFGARIAIIDTGADTVVRIDNDVFITLKNVTGDGDNSISIADFILA